MDDRAWFLVHPRGLVVRRDGGRVSPLGDVDVMALGLSGEGAHALGPLAGVEGLGLAMDEAGPLPPPFEVAPLRGLFGALDDASFMMAGKALQLVEWAATHRFCGRCATPTERVPTERCMRCPACGLLAYPRISPAIIVLVRRGDEALLARGTRFPVPFYSTLAGFVEVGESLEETLIREVREEVGLVVKEPRYFASQSWPFPHSLMVGFFATWESGEIRAEASEIVDAGWYRATELPVIPPRFSIARRLIDVWIEEVTGALG
jgi:NAD+ diphosphatase